MTRRGYEPRLFDLASLEAAIELMPRHKDEATEMDRATALGLRREHVWRLRHEGLTERQADELAVRLGLHPGNVWPSWWSLAEPDDDDAGWLPDEAA